MYDPSATDNSEVFCNIRDSLGDTFSCNLEAYLKVEGQVDQDIVM